MAQYATHIGLAGVVLVLLAYGLFAAHKLKGDDWRYPALNMLGTCGILYSLMYDWNLPSVAAQITWIILSIAGLIRIAWKKNSHG
jgi:hypothetical protein